MSYWKGLMLAAVFDLIWIMGCPAQATEPATLPSQQVMTLEEFNTAGELEDGLMLHLQEQPSDVVAMQKLADLDMRQGWFEAAIGPLARALQLDPSRRRLWVMLDDAVKKGGRGTITDEELAEAAAAFVESLEMWGHGC
jgi:predicted Zn-dependent protease